MVSETHAPIRCSTHKIHFMFRHNNEIFSVYYIHRIENKQKGHSSRNLSSLCPHACRITHVHYVNSGQSIAFSDNRNAGLAIPPLFWPVNCIKIGGHVALLSCSTVHSLYCVTVSDEASLKIWSYHANFKSLSLLISLEIHWFYGL